MPIFNNFFIWVDLMETSIPQVMGGLDLPHSFCGISGDCTLPNRYISTSNSRVSFGYYSASDVSNAVDGIHVLMFGRLDQRDRVATEMGLRSDEHDDASLIRAAYRSWDTAWSDHTYGSVAAVVIDERRQRLIASRDELGRRPLYFVLTDAVLLLASAPDLLLRHPVVTRRRDPLWLAAYFAMQPSSAEPECSPFGDIKQIRPNQRLIWTVNHASRFETGQFRLGRSRLRFPRDEDYAEGFRERLSTAIADRTRGIEKLGILLSGGMDSCPVACLAADHFRKTGQSLTAYSWTLGQYPEADETRELSECAEFAGIPTVLLPADDLLPFADPLDWPMDVNSPSANAYWPMFRAIYRRAAEDSCRVLLQGTLGDLLYPRNWMIADALSDGHLLLAAREFDSLLKRVGWRGVLGAPAFRNCVKRVLPWWKKGPYGRPKWLTLEVANRLGYMELPPFEHYRPDQYRNLLGAHVFQRQVGHQVDAVNYGIYRLDPFIDWDLIDYMLAIPAYQAQRLTQTKFLTRNAMRGRMPESLRLRPRGSPLFSFYFAGFERSREKISKFLRRSDCTWPEYVRRDVLLGALDEPSLPLHLKAVTERVLSYEVWNRRLEQLPGR